MGRQLVHFHDRVGNQRIHGRIVEFVLDGVQDRLAAFVIGIEEISKGLDPAGCCSVLLVAALDDRVFTAVDVLAQIVDGLGFCRIGAISI
ncbi:hypothetical protein J4G43_009190 [Bradyrhizobium barranii subsp. barranii]|uniref:Uncharacterized protein n=1 Tax=Bradyrhizobium barranii subsp. barranii TaxID=2823807 RepID=A0A939M1K7_9BRAD|nr:hypothetical protein [Bradyrhizobium barranii]UEM17882.1 hypothetical protein J4G43_009190 [Bradyrhizobium barranii subsp. barranii]